MDAEQQGDKLEVVEICAGAGGQSLGLELAGFDHRLAVELDRNAARTLEENRPAWKVAVGDVADPEVWNPMDFKGVDLLAGGVPCPPFSIAGKQLGANDERDLFAWAVELCGRMEPRALLLENVKGLSANRFTGYRQHVLDRLYEQGYIGRWELLHASDYGVSQLRPRFVLVALKEEYAEYFKWPEKNVAPAPTVGELLKDLMGAGGWEGVEEWSRKANGIAPTIVGGSKKHGGADLGPSRAKKAWADLAVDAWGIANEPPGPGFKPSPRTKGEEVTGPKLTAEMVARIQGWYGEEYEWEFTGKKTSQYRQIGNAFPPPVARAVGESIASALRKEHKQTLFEHESRVFDPVYKILKKESEKKVSRYLDAEKIAGILEREGTRLSHAEVEQRLVHLGHDFELDRNDRKNGSVGYRLGEFKAFLGQDDHQRHELFSQYRAKIS
ncbi:DNA (cytosine-5-)-methyltransferase [Glycomyces sp. NPDC047010]|uniref:DNA cytosine methyltransferase n=1 Tax=Glycomyces sp. NPDC047010 TaxID=3155023 RepID=UPI0033E397B5